LKKEEGLVMDELALQPVERCEVVVLVDNYIDVLLPSQDGVIRPPLARGGMIPEDTILAEHGLSVLLKLTYGGEPHLVLMDAGYTDQVLPHNLNYLGISLSSVELVVMSHGHMDHYGGLVWAVEQISQKPVPIVIHPDAFATPRFFKLPDGNNLRFPVMDRKAVEGAGAQFHEIAGPNLQMANHLLVTGAVERVTSFEKGMPNAYVKRGDELVHDDISDDQGCVVNIRDEGIVVISGCAHAGIINTIKYAQKLTGIDRVLGVIGGFHLSGPVFEPIIPDTIAAMKEINPKRLVPMHCTGWNAIKAFEAAMPEAFALNASGTTYQF
jgi:7,8-dihydropterin-6-yl-methyl-4-(beta-D-ribofuranosyl)aminobenzene 5'-phosphate synthase